MIHKNISRFERTKINLLYQFDDFGTILIILYELCSVKQNYWLAGVDRHVNQANRSRDGSDGSDVTNR